MPWRPGDGLESMIKAAEEKRDNLARNKKMMAERDRMAAESCDRYTEKFIEVAEQKYNQQPGQIRRPSILKPDDMER